MEKLKKIWLWISGGIVAMVGILFVFFRLLSSSKENREAKKKLKKLDEQVKETEKKIKKTTKKKNTIKSDIKKTEKKIKNTKAKLKNTKEAKDVLDKFKKKYKK